MPLLRLDSANSEAVPEVQSKYVYFFGEGSEHLEERLRKDFPRARIARLDRDTARTKRQFQERSAPLPVERWTFLWVRKCWQKDTISIA